MNFILYLYFFHWLFMDLVNWSVLETVEATWCVIYSIYLCASFYLNHHCEVYLAVFNMGGGNPSGMMPIQQQQQQHGSQAFGSMASNAQNLQSGMVTLQNTQQNHPNFSQQRQQNPQWWGLGMDDFAWNPEPNFVVLDTWFRKTEPNFLLYFGSKLFLIL